MKAVDPVGFSYKITEYLSLFGMHGLSGLSMCLSVSLCTAETFLGLLLFLRIWKRTTAVCFLAAMLAFTALTLRLVTDPLGTITECGCFGEAVHLSNGVSFAKNLVLLAVAAALAYSVFKEGGRGGFRLRQLTLALGAFALSLAIPLLSCLFLPPFYFLDYNVGDRITEDNRIELFDQNLEHVSTDIGNNGKPAYMIGVRKNIDDNTISKIECLHKTYIDGEINLFIATSGDGSETRYYNDLPVYYIDDTTLKSILRTDIGVVAFSNSRIVGKWNLIHTGCRFRGNYGNELAGQLARRYGFILILAILYSSAIVLHLRLFRLPMPKLKRGM